MFLMLLRKNHGEGMPMRPNDGKHSCEGCTSSTLIRSRNGLLYL